MSEIRKARVFPRVPSDLVVGPWVWSHPLFDALVDEPADCYIHADADHEGAADDGRGQEGNPYDFHHAHGWSLQSVMWKTRIRRFGTWLGIVLTLIIGVFLLTNFYLPGTSILFRGTELTYGPGAKAALFALASGALFIVSWLPANDTRSGLFALWLNRGALAGTFILTGWYWLQSAVDEDTWGHFSFPLFAALLFCAAVVLTAIVMVSLGFPLYYLGIRLVRWFRNRT